MKLRKLMFLFAMVLCFGVLTVSVYAADTWVIKATPDRNEQWASWDADESSQLPTSSYPAWVMAQSDGIVFEMPEAPKRFQFIYGTPKVDNWWKEFNDPGTWWKSGKLTISFKEIGVKPAVDMVDGDGLGGYFGVVDQWWSFPPSEFKITGLYFYTNGTYVDPNAKVEEEEAPVEEAAEAPEEEAAPEVTIVPPIAVIPKGGRQIDLIPTFNKNGTANVVYRAVVDAYRGKMEWDGSSATVVTYSRKGDRWVFTISEIGGYIENGLLYVPQSYASSVFPY